MLKWVRTAHSPNCILILTGTDRSLAGRNFAAVLAASIAASEASAIYRGVELALWFGHFVVTRDAEALPELFASNDVHLAGC
jgi:hypothetical protein